MEACFQENRPALALGDRPQFLQEALCEVVIAEHRRPGQHHRIENVGPGVRRDAAHRRNGAAGVGIEDAVQGAAPAGLRRLEIREYEHARTVAEVEDLLRENAAEHDKFRRREGEDAIDVAAPADKRAVTPVIAECREAPPDQCDPFEHVRIFRRVPCPVEVGLEQCDDIVERWPLLHLVEHGNADGEGDAMIQGESSERQGKVRVLLEEILPGSVTAFAIAWRLEDFLHEEGERGQPAARRFQLGEQMVEAFMPGADECPFPLVRMHEHNQVLERREVSVLDHRGQRDLVIDGTDEVEIHGLLAFQPVDGRGGGQSEHEHGMRLEYVPEYVRPVGKKVMAFVEDEQAEATVAKQGHERARVCMGAAVAVACRDALIGERKHRRIRFRIVTDQVSDPVAPYLAHRVDDVGGALAVLVHPLGLDGRIGGKDDRTQTQLLEEGDADEGLARSGRSDDMKAAAARAVTFVQQSKRLLLVGPQAHCEHAFVEQGSRPDLVHPEKYCPAARGAIVRVPVLLARRRSSEYFVALSHPLQDLR